MTYALLTGVLAAALALAAGNPLIGFLRNRKVGKAISAEGPETHMVKAGTPTMGGLLFIGAAAVAAFAMAVPRDADVLLPLIIALVAALIGWYDDLGTLVGREAREAHDRHGMILKLAGFAVIAGVAAYVLYDVIDAPRLLVPHYGGYDIGALYILVVIAVIVSTTSAVAVHDGVDGMAGATTAVAFSAYGSIALVQEQDALAAFCFALVGALAGFLWFNAYPARIFMGDTGSLALGAALGVVALMTGWWLLLPVIGIAFVLEIASDVVQIGYFRATGGKRIFRMAPLHHHFEELGWHETTVATRFIVLSVLAALLGVALAALD